jgi:hypothetical protein
VKRAVVVAALIASVLAGLGERATGSSAEPRLAHLAAAEAEDANRGVEWRWEHQCRFRNLEGGPSFSTREIRLELACAAHRWTPSKCSRDNGCNSTAEGKVYEVFGCESGFNEYADNPISSASGIGQALDSTWDGWVDRFRRFIRRWSLGDSVWNGRANAILSVRVAAGGWGPWEYGHCA